MKDARSILGDGNGHRRLLPLAAVALLLIGGGVMLFTRGGDQPAPQTQAVAATEKADQVAIRQASPDERIDIVNALGLTQQQTIDQLQFVQDQVAAQQAEIRKLIDKVATLSDKLEALQSPPSPTPTAALDVTNPKTAHRR